MKKLFTGSVVGAAMLLAPIAAMAAVSVDNVLFNGAPNVTVSAGSSVNTQVYITNDSANDVESLFVTFPNSGGATQQGICYDVSDQIGTSPVNGWTFDVNVKAPSNSGVWDIVVSTHGTNGDAADNICSTSADDTSTFNGRVTVTSTASSPQPSQTQTQIDALTALVNALIAKINALTNPVGAPSTSAACAALAAKLLGTQDNVYNQANVQLQGYLLSEGMSIPALTAGASFGFKGPQTNAALAAYKASKQCI